MYRQLVQASFGRYSYITQTHGMKDEFWNLRATSSVILVRDDRYDQFTGDKGGVLQW
jgi:hypothetical protein